MEYEKLTYPEAIESLAQEVGIALPEPDAEYAAKEQQQQSLQDVANKAAHWFQQQLQADVGMEARQYLLSRGVTAETVAAFQLGYAPEGKQALIQHLVAEGITPGQLEAVGLTIQPDDGVPYGRFRNRIIFPITSAGGDVIAFGGRLLQKSDYAPKYLNSPETELFHKGEILYNWKMARREITEDAPLLIVEGYMDVIALHQGGFPQGVAPLGTALTEHHLRKIWQACDAPILCLDGDAAGQRAMWRSAELALPLLQPGKTLRFCTLPAGQDPDDVLKSDGPEALRKFLQQALPLSQVIWQHLKREYDGETPEKRAALEAELEALALKIEHSSLQQHFRRFFRDKLWARKQKSTQPIHAHIKQLAAGDGRKTGQIAAEKQLLRAILCQPALLEDGDAEATLERLELLDPSLADLQQWLLATSLDEQTADMWPEAAQRLKDDTTTPLPEIFHQENPAPLLLKQHWQWMLDALQLLKMEEELTQTQQALAHDMTEEKLRQLQALQAEILHLKEAQTDRYAEG
jgi:DNA primase